MELQNPSRSSECSQVLSEEHTHCALSSDPSFITRIQSLKKEGGEEIRLIMLMLADLGSVLIEHLCA